ncbi:MAG: N-acetyltransferase [Bacteroidia bacterium]|nr:N-acetyltransferase [Bacteroidia bacterium]
MLNIRKATTIDLASITEIYNDAILNTNSTFDTEVKTIENRTQWFKERDENFPIIVAERSGKVIGYAALNKWSERKAYDVTAEISVYIHPEHRKQGIGKQLIEMIVAIGEQTNLKTIIARITEGNDHSVYLHERNGFKMVGTLRQVGKKFGKLLDVAVMQKVYENKTI